MSSKILIVGGGDAGLSAAVAARKTDRKAEITMVTRDQRPTYSLCGIPYVIGREIRNFQDLVIYPLSYYNMMRIRLLLQANITSIDPDDKVATVEKQGGKWEKLAYNTLVLATGSTPFIPSTSGVDKQGVFTIRTLDDCVTIDQAVENAQSGVVVGGGFISVEMADALARRGLEVAILYRRSHLLRTLLDPNMAEIVHRKLEEKGVQIKFGRVVDEIVGEGRVQAILSAGEKIATDLVIFATGTIPNVQLARMLDAELGPTGGVKVNNRAETTIPQVFAAGDCAECLNLLTEKPFTPGLGTVAARQGTVAGVNAAGGNTTFPGALGATVSKISELEFGSTGLTSQGAEEAKVDVVSGTILWKTRARYFPGAKDVKVKLLCERSSGRLVGGQVVGGEGVASMIDLISAAIQSKTTAKQLAKVDTCYAPPVAEVWNPIVLAAESVVKKT